MSGCGDINRRTAQPSCSRRFQILTPVEQVWVYMPWSLAFG